MGFVDGDDWVKADMYETLFSALQKSSCMIATCGMFFAGEKKSIKYKDIRREKYFSSKEALIEILKENNIDVSACNKLYKRELFENLRYPVGENNEDAAVIVDLLCSSNGIIHVGKAMYYYYQREGSISRTPSKSNIEDQYQHALKIKNQISDCYKELIPYADFYVYMQLITILKNIVQSKNESAYEEEIHKYVNELYKMGSFKLWSKLTVKRKLLLCFIAIYYRGIL